MCRLHGRAGYGPWLQSVSCQRWSRAVRGVRKRGAGGTPARLALLRTAPWGGGCRRWRRLGRTQRRGVSPTWLRVESWWPDQGALELNSELAYLDVREEPEAKMKAPRTGLRPAACRTRPWTLLPSRPPGWSPRLNPLVPVIARTTGSVPAVPQCGSEVGDIQAVVFF